MNKICNISISSLDIVWTASQIDRSILMMQDPDESANYLQQAMVKPSLLLDGDTPRLIDEW